MLNHYDRERIIWKSSCEPLTRLLLLALNSFVDGNGQCWPSFDRLASMTGMGRSTVIRKIKQLGDDGFVTKAERTTKEGRQTSNTLTIYFEVIEKTADNVEGSRSDTPELRGPALNVEGSRSENLRGPALTSVRGPALTPELSILSDLSIRELSNEKKEPLNPLNGKTATLPPAVKVFKSRLESLLSPEPEPELTAPEASPEPDTEQIITVEAEFVEERANVPGRSAALNIAASVEILPVDTLALQFANKSSCDPLYARFKGSFQGLCVIVGANFGRHNSAKEAWQALVDEGAIDGNFWRGLELCLSQTTADFKAGKKCLGLKGAANWLADREWEVAIARDEYVSQSAKMGIDVEDPNSVKASTLAAKNLEASKRMFAKLAMERENA